MRSAVLVLLLLASACGGLRGVPEAYRLSAPVPVPDFSQSPAAAAVVEEASAAAVALGSAGESLTMVNGNGDEAVVAGAVLVPATEEAAAAFVTREQERLLGRGVLAFRTESSQVTSGVAFVASRDPLDAVRASSTNADNYEMGTEGILAFLEDLRRDHPFAVTGAGYDWLEVRFATPLRDPKDLARRVLEIGPDDERGVRQMTADLRADPTCFFWWD